MPMYNLLEYSKNYSMIITKYSDNKINSNKTITSKSFECKTKLIGNTLNSNNILKAEFFVPLKYFSNFWRSLDLPSINCEIELKLSCSKECIISEMSITPAVSGNLNVNPPFPDVAAIQTTGTTFQINNAKLYVPFVTFSVNDNIKFLENSKQGFKRTISWNKYRSEKTTQPKNNNLDYLIDPTFRNINRLFVLSFKNGNDNPTSNSFDEYYKTLVEIKDFNALIDYKPFFDQPLKNKQEGYEKLIEMSKNDNYTTENLLDFSSHQNYFKLIDIDLSVQANMSIPQQINFPGKLKEDDHATMFFVSQNQQKIILNFSLDSLIVTE